LETFFNQRTERGTLLLGYTPGLPDQLVGEFYRRLHTGFPYCRYGSTVSLILVGGKAGNDLDAVPL
jgi:hypothetical protein